MNHFSNLPVELQSKIFRIAYPKQAKAGRYYDFMIWKRHWSRKAKHRPSYIVIELPLE